mgnify:CR=1 FL=1
MKYKTYYIHIIYLASYKIRPPPPPPTNAVFTCSKSKVIMALNVLNVAAGRIEVVVCAAVNGTFRLICRRWTGPNIAV